MEEEEAIKFVCPLLGKYCKGNRCMWFILEEDGEDGNCAISKIAKQIRGGNK